MSRVKNEEGRNCNEGIAQQSCWTVVLLCIVLALIGVAMAVGIVRYKRNPQTAVEESRSALLDSLHVFPPIEFADSLYQSRVMTTYDDDSPRDVFYFEIDSNGIATQNIVHESHYYQNQQKYIDGNVHDGGRDGLWYAYHPDGKVQTMAHYVNGKEEGRYTVYHENGAVYYTGEYHQGQRVGTWLFYDEEEQLVSEKNYDEEK